MHDIVSIGDCTIDAFVDLLEASVTCDAAGEDCKLTMPFATKVPIKNRVQRMPAGNSNNNAVGSARLGLDTAFYTVVGDDENAITMLKNLQKEGVSTTLVQHDPKNGTNFHVVLSYGPERTILIYHEQFTYHLPDLHTRWAYLSSVGKTGAAELNKQVISQVKAKNIKIGFNPGTFQLELKKSGLKGVLQLTEVLFLNKEEAELLLEVGESEPAKLLSGMLKLGPKIAVITDGPKGSYVSDGSQELFLPVCEDQLPVERTGAGDAYGTAFVAAMIRGKSLSEAMRWGTFNSGSVIGQLGPQAGLMTRDELDRWLTKYSDFQPKPLTKSKSKAKARS
jgi:ribokinase